MENRILQYLNNVKDYNFDCTTFSNFTDFINRKGLGIDNLNVIHINVRSINKHWLSLLSYINDILYLLDIIVLTEIRINADETHCYQIDKFQQFSRCRTTGNGGGIMYGFCERYVHSG